MTPAGEAGEAEMQVECGVGMVSISHPRQLYLSHLAVLSFAIYGARRCSCWSCGFGLDLEIAKSELTTRRLDAPPTPASGCGGRREKARTFF
jgi:hypothetical protein